MTLEIRIDQDLCISSGRCVSDEPTVFAFDDDELATVIDAGQSLDSARLIRLARNCPGQAISLRDEHGDVVDLD
jgi:ferredoxin